MKKRHIPVSGPSITSSEIALVQEAVSSAWYDNANSFNASFENAFSDYIGRRHAISLPSCTSAIHLSLLSLGIGPGDEVIVPDITWIATAAPVFYVGATPVFCDIDPHTWCISSHALEQCITDSTRAVIVVDLYGGMPDMSTIRSIADARGIDIIEDAAQAIGSRFNDRLAGSFGRTGVFSFHGSKTMTTGEGGMLVTDDEHIYERTQILRDHGRLPGDTSFFNTEVGYKYKMSALQAALGLAQLRRIDDLVNKKRTIFSWYSERLESNEHLTLNHEPGGVYNTYWMTTILLSEDLKHERDSVMQKLASRGIDTRPFFHPLSSLPAFEGLPQSSCAKDGNIHAYSVSPRGLNLPSGLNLKESDIDYICSTLTDILEHY